MRTRRQFSSTVSANYVCWEENVILKMFDSKNLSVILTCVFRMHEGVVSSGLLTSGSLFVLNVHACWQCKGIPSGHLLPSEHLLRP